MAINEALYPKGYLYYPVSSFWNSLSSQGKSDLLLSLVKKAVEATKVTVNSDYLLSLNYLVGVLYNNCYIENYDIGFYLGTSKRKFFDFMKVSNGSKLNFFAILLDVEPWGFEYNFDYSINVPPISLPSIPDAVVPDTTYKGFLEKERLFSDFTSFVDTLLKSKPTFSAFEAGVKNIVNTRIKGITLLDYYFGRAQYREDYQYEDGMPLYRDMYLRVIAPSGSSIISRSIKIDYTLISDISSYAPADLLERGVSIAGNALIEKVGMGGEAQEVGLARRAYTIHNNDFDIWSWIEQEQRENNYSPKLITFPDFEKMKSDLSKQDDFFGKKSDLQSDLAKAKQFYKDMLTPYKDILGLTDAQIDEMASRRADADMVQWLNGNNQKTIAQATVAQTQIEQDRREQEKAEKKAKDEQKAKEEEEKQKEKDKAIEVAKAKEKEIKKKVAEYNKKVLSMYNKYSKIPQTAKQFSAPTEVSDIRTDFIPHSYDFYFDKSSFKN